MNRLVSSVALLVALATPVSGITLDELAPSALGASGKTLNLTFEGGDTDPPPSGTWMLTFDQSPANQATIRNFPGGPAASTTTWNYTGPAFPDSHNYALGANPAFGDKGGSLTVWISVAGARFSLTVDGVSSFGGVTFPNAPDIAVFQPAGTNLFDGVAKKRFGSAKADGRGVTKSFTIRNTGSAPLAGLSIKVTGKNKKDFTAEEPRKTRLAAGDATTFKVTFDPASPGAKTPRISIKSNDPDESPFEIVVDGRGK